ncbi:MAG: beta-ketoacyl synthase N-terminal-like domain-containing protein [Candidatus Omnitrophica bacterium]|nr:beta-ketoacyl synthase N-terminal-like domain-containing protein [Candidatus Omnitrophota bacterium]MDD5487926.1 beta-ketoacyl synthase N-terminal-like domain-containing protein [Candidatus Omnitrophota bacterium]
MYLDIEKSERDRIVITGVGPLCSLGSGTKQVWESIDKGKQNLVKHKHTIDDMELGQFYLHKIENFNLDDYALPKGNYVYVNSLRGFRDPDVDLHYFLAAVKLALEDSGYDYDLKENKVGLVLAHENPGMESLFEDITKSAYEIFKKSKQNDKLDFIHELYDDCEESGYSLQTFTYLYSVAKVFDLHGYSLFINNACASGLFAIEAAARNIRSGLNTATVVAAIDSPLKIYKYMWFKKLGLYNDEDGKMKPFSKKANGVVFGDGGAALILETLESAKKRGATIYAEYLGGGFCLEGWKITVPDITSNYYEKAFEEAIYRSGIKANSIDLVNPHGVGLKVTDLYETRTIQRVLSQRSAMVSAFKPLVGHNLGGSALLETVIGLLAMQHQTVPATLNCEDVIDGCDLNIIKNNKKAKIETFAKMAIGFAGYNAVGIFRKV